MNPFSRDLLNFRPVIAYVSPESTDTIPEYQEPEISKVDQVNQLKQGFDNVVKVADIVEELIDSKVGKFKAKLNIFGSPEDMATGQALARTFPDKAKEVMPGIMVVDEITYDMFKHCVKHIENHAKDQAKKSLMPRSTNVSPTRTSFGGVGGSDNRPEINNMSAPIAPLDIPAFMAAGIPILFSMLFPLINTAIKTNIVGHSHPVIVPPALVPIPSGPGIPVIP